MALFILIILLTALCGGLAAYLSARSFLIKQFKSDLLAMAKAGTLLVDAERHQQLRPGNEGTEYYRQQREILQRYQRQTGVRYVYTMTAGGPEGARYAVDADDDVKTYKKIGSNYEILDDMRVAFSGTATTDQEPIRDVDGTFLSGYAPLRNAQGEVVGILGVDMDSSYIQKRTLELFWRVLLTWALLGIPISVCVGIIFARRTGNSIGEVVKRVGEMARNSGKLTQKIVIRSGDELEELANEVNNLMANTRQLVGQIRAISQEVSRATDNVLAISESNAVSVNQMAVAADSIAGFYESQEGKIEGCINTLQSLGETLDQLAEHSRKMQAATDETNALSAKGLGMVSSMNSVYTQGTETAGLIANLMTEFDEKFEAIGQVVEIITSVSEQTDLLALNASIEAARAGEYGKGFSVVAEQVGKLAEKTSTAAQDVSELVDRMRSGIKGVGAASSRIRDSQLVQTEAIGHTEQALVEITDSMGVIGDQIGLVGQALVSMEREKEEIRDTIREITGLLRQIVGPSRELSNLASGEAASIEEITASIQALDELVGVLHESVRMFEVD